MAVHVLPKLKAFAADRRGGIALIFGFALPVLGIGAAAVMEYSSLSRQRTSLQRAVDGAALAAARELSLVNADETRVATVGRGVIVSSLAHGSTVPASVSVAVINNRSAVEVQASQAVGSIMGKLLSLPEAELRAAATATLRGSTRLCMLGLDPSLAGTVRLTKDARLTAERCSVYSNSKSTIGLTAQMNAVLKAERICSSGGYSGRRGVNFSPEPITDCPQIEDPLASRAPPFVAGCDYNNRQILGGVHKLSPGVYCGGLDVKNNAKVTLSPGIYIMNGGPLTVSQGASLEGDYVGFYFRGQSAILNLGVDSTISLSAPKDGALAGILFFEDPGSPPMRRFSVSSDNARKLLGTIYLPKASFYVDANKPVADLSAYTVVVARQIELSAGPNLVLNANYGSTDVPVPKGVGPIGADVNLSQ